MFRALTLAALLAATTMPALAQTSAANSTDVSAPPASTTTKPSATMNKAAPATTPTTRSSTMTNAAPAATTTTTTNGAAAAPSPAMVKMMQTCQADFAKACPGIAPAAPEMRTCVTNNFSSLGQPCQGAIMEMMNAGGAG